MCTSRINHTCKSALCRVAHDGGGVAGPANRCQYERKLEGDRDRTYQRVPDGEAPV